ncbi:hypothetical protein D910_09167 [Dendroctonus ponderosae]|uniref:Carboxylesterase type B domain-containing protein n=1 Tax=Dendroctonus ponderosae TaxID=77166 RepID=U4UFR5_DENPD|nr:hypothetical protein D910_09167 [Dendroctonus ponderosae]
MRCIGCEASVESTDHLDLRYMPPVTPSTWKTTKLADRFGAVCPQRPPDIGNRSEALLEFPRGRLLYLEKLLPLLANQSEDCLYLNIYVPRAEIKASIEDGIFSLNNVSKNEIRNKLCNILTNFKGCLVHNTKCPQAMQKNLYKEKEEEEDNKEETKIDRE